MARVYTNYSPSASGVQYRGFLEYDPVTNNATTASYALDFGVKATSSVNVDYELTCGATGYTSRKGETYTSYSDGKIKENWITWYGTPLDYVSYTKGHSPVTKTFSVSVHSTDGVSSWQNTVLTGSASVTIPAKYYRTVSYNANGGTGSVSNQTAWYGENLTLSNGAGLTRTNYKLNGWNTKADGTGTHYNLSANYLVYPSSATESVTLYAEWELIAVPGYGRISSSIKQGIYYIKTNGSIKIPHAGYVKVNGAWKQIKT